MSGRPCRSEAGALNHWAIAEIARHQVVTGELAQAGVKFRLAQVEKSLGLRRQQRRSWAGPLPT